MSEEESLWGIVEKFKFANVLDGRQFYRSFSINNRKNFRKNKEGSSSLNHIKYLDTQKLFNVFQLDFTSHAKNFVNRFPIYKLYIPDFHKDLFFCKECLQEGFHSLFHQILIIEYCPYHPQEKLTNKCPHCQMNFRYYNFGSFENPFCCEQCGKSILKPKSFLLQIEGWKSNKTFQGDCYNLINITDLDNKKIYVVDTVKPKTEDANNYYSNIVKLLKLDYQSLKLPYSKENTAKYKLKYPFFEKPMVGYNLRAIIPGKIRMHPPIVTNFLDIELFNQSKAVFKSVERYILKQFDKKTIIKIRKCYGPNGYNPKSQYKSAFIEWKNECYYRWEKPETYMMFNHKVPTSYYDKQIFPYLFYSSKFTVMEILDSIDSFSVFINIFSKLLFKFLYNRFLEIQNKYVENDDKTLLRPHLIISMNSQYYFI